MPRQKRPFHIMLPADELEEVRAFAELVGRPMSGVARDALQAYMTRHREDARRMAELAERLKEGGKAR
jgi:predicted DNA-binding protein